MVIIGFFRKMCCTQHTLENHVDDKSEPIMEWDVCTDEGGGGLAGAQASGQGSS